MSAKPLTREERRVIIGCFATCECPDCRRDRRWDATVQAAEERAERLRAGLVRVDTFRDWEYAADAISADDAARGEA